MTNDSIKMVGAKYFPPVLAQQLIFIYVHPQSNVMVEIWKKDIPKAMLWLKSRTTHVRAPLRASP